ncbi:class II aldolase/adducin family protein [Paraburkholderia sp.]|uniref:class II aldolase/adducin family protein n=1 Tax=Paraburkholderia sp. TaxID=1926495 RepID=UPI002D4C6264|nr:class II aldolase/adducin family protein [Paraburkholderia sp.]HZZ02694.1 class II aldolase/adducin family protein [Paraburkholderia sp.]
MTRQSIAGSETAIREEICVVGASLYNRGYTVGTAGNISARLEDEWLITPTDACLGRLDPACIDRIDLAGRWVSGDKPSKTLALPRDLRQQSRGARHCAHAFDASGRAHAFRQRERPGRLARRRRIAATFGVKW